mmetsp:Transcript_14854/g.49774  ORF Transcript_14854/g.49774 Transcript_14854/m.49774 type:complete len:237 (-) Transcript_14854:543-1253(-)
MMMRARKVMVQLARCTMRMRSPASPGYVAWTWSSAMMISPLDVRFCSLAAEANMSSEMAPTPKCSEKATKASVASEAPLTESETAPKTRSAFCSITSAKYRFRPWARTQPNIVLSTSHLIILSRSARKRMAVAFSKRLSGPSEKPMICCVVMTEMPRKSTRASMSMHARPKRGHSRAGGPSASSARSSVIDSAHACTFSCRLRPTSTTQRKSGMKMIAGRPKMRKSFAPSWRSMPT